MEEYIYPITMVLTLLAGILSGFPVALVLGGVGIIFILLTGTNFNFLNIIVSRMYAGVIENWVLLAIPLFVFMGSVLEKSGLASRALITMQLVMGNRRGGLAISVIFLGVILAATTGVIGASVVLLGSLALPILLEQKNDPKISLGLVAASSTLGILIPPSIMLIIVGSILQISVGDLFMAAIMPGLLLASLYIVYILFIVKFQPEKLPPAPVTSNIVSGMALYKQLIKDLIAPVALIVSVLGAIVSGLATPTEAAAIGAIVAVLLAVSTNGFALSLFRESVFDTAKTTAMIIFVMVGATCFSAVFKRIGGEEMIDVFIFSMGLEAYGTLILLMVVIFVLGFFLEWVEISFIILPIFGPIIAALNFGFDLTQEQILVWFATLVALNLQTSFLTPPFGYALFYLKGVAPPGISTRMIFAGSIPFVFVQLSALVIAIMWPQLVLWLPSYVFGAY